MVDVQVVPRLAASVAVFVILSMVTAPAVAVGNSGQFIDDDGVPAEQALEWLAERDVIHGCDPPANRRSCPDRVLTRAQAAKILVLLARHEGVLEPDRPGSVDHFTDDTTTWDGAAEPFIDHLADLAIVHGCDPPANTSFCPHASLRRGQITKMVVRTFDLEAPEGFVDPWDDTGGHFFEDSARVAAYHRLFDSTAGSFDGYDEVTRAEFASVVVRVFEPDLCAENPFTAGRVADLEQAHPGVAFTGYAYDLETGCAYGMNRSNQQRTASVFKVMVMGGTLLEAQEEGRAPSQREMDLLTPMITRSTNPPVRELWQSFGAAPWFTDQAEIFGLDETTVVGEHGQPWGRTTTSAHDQADLLRQVLLGHGGPLEAPGRAVAFDLMTSVTPSQTWGVTRGVPAGWDVAQKNGFAGQIANSVGVVYDGAGEPVYVVAILTYGWPSWDQGIPAVEQIGGWVSSTLAG